MPYDRRPDPGEYNAYYDRYVALVPAGDIIALLTVQLDDTTALLRDLSEEQALHAYAPGKWSIKEVLGHMMDAERIFMIRALRFGRGDATPLPSFDENAYAPAGAFNARPLASLMSEFTAVRRATVALLAGLPADAWQRTGIASGYPVSVRGLAWITAGHELHHRQILAQRYLVAAG
ncbi:MAG: DinB family protein [Gemmatimonadetes bacterium]|nr:DinB family protein [Gemmatimonadota bacterium]